MGSVLGALYSQTLVLNIGALNIPLTGRHGGKVTAHTMKDVRIEARGPSGAIQQLEVEVGEDQCYNIKFKPHETGLWQISFRQGNAIAMDPVYLRVFCADKVKAFALEYGIVGQSYSLTVEGLEAKPGEVVVEVKHREEPVVSSVIQIGAATYWVGFTPRELHYSISVHYAGTVLPGCPWSLHMFQGVPFSGELVEQIKLPPSGTGSDDVDDLCWTPGGDLLVTRFGAQDLWRVELDQASWRVTRQHKLLEGEGYYRVSCGQDGRWAVTVWDYDMSKCRIKLHQPEQWVEGGEEWRPEEVGVPGNTVIVGDEIWVNPISSGRVEVYGSDRRWKRSMRIGRRCNNIEYMTLSPHGHLVASTIDEEGHRVCVLDTGTGSLGSVGGEDRAETQFIYPSGVATTAQGHILLCDSHKDRVPVLGPGGQFLHQLQVDLGDVGRPVCISVMEKHSQPPLMAIGGDGGAIKIFKLMK